NGQGHEKDFLTVGSMGHSSSIAFALALQKPDRRVWCIDGDGAALMHMGAMAIIGTNNPNNFVHIIINNAAHESVGGMPTVAGSIDMCKIAEGCGYPYVFSVSDYEHLDRTLLYVKENNKLAFIEAKADISARADLGRPSTTAKENKNSFMKNL
ncbi:MAG TPA: phosphonopyruvate decarboxylase, partial [Clostridiales bacterium]|nr:phosphonopyruvate decarboxylase [Clostridiales bacterium]